MAANNHPIGANDPATSPWTRFSRRLEADPRSVTEVLDWVADERVRRNISRDDSIAIVAECFAELGEESRAAIAAWSESVLHVLEVFCEDPSPVVRAACARNLNNIDVRVQRKLARDRDPFVVLALIESAPLAAEVVEFFLAEVTFDAIRYRLATKRLATRYLEQLAADPCPQVAAAASDALDARALRGAIPIPTSIQASAPSSEVEDLPEAA